MRSIESYTYELLNITESAAISAATMSGYGDRNTADLFATQAMRKIMNEIDMDGKIVIGEGERDEAPMLFIGEKVGTGKGIEIDFAVDPLEGTNSCATYNPDTICVLAASERGGLTHASDCYMNKLIVGPRAKSIVDINDPVAETIAKIAESEGISKHQVIITVLERERHHKLINDIRDAGAKVKTITDGDIMAGIGAVLPHTIGHAVMGIGAAPEGVITASAMRALGGGMQGIFLPRDENDKKRLKKMGITDFDKVYHEDELAPGKEIVFIATGVTNGEILDGVKNDEYSIMTNSLIMNAHRQTIQYVRNEHKMKDKINI